MPSPSSGQPKPGDPRLQPRDYELLRGLFECRMMTLTHATALYFDGHYEAASKRMQALKAAGYVGDRRQRVGEPSLLFLTKKAFEHLMCEGKLCDYPRLTDEQFLKRSRIKDATVGHELGVLNVRVAITTAITAAPGFRIDEFTTWPLLSEFTALHPIQKQEIIVRPDGFLRIAETTGEESEYHFFLELDRSNEVQRVLAEKAMCYRNFYTSGGFALRCGAQAADYRHYPVRVLIILQNAERRNNLAERLMNCSPPIKFQAWLTTREEVLRDPLGAIWMCPLDYARVTSGTAYAPELRRGTESYVRRPEREKLVEARIVKRTLFQDALDSPA